MFEERILRRVKVTRARESLRYWTPALVGAGIACVAMFSALQMVSVYTPLPKFSGKGNARLQKLDWPSLLLEDTGPHRSNRSISIK